VAKASLTTSFTASFHLSIETQHCYKWNGTLIAFSGVTPTRFGINPRRQSFVESRRAIVVAYTIVTSVETSNSFPL
jgi:hypothetical protein